MDIYQREFFVAALQSGAPGTIKLGAQLAGIPACDHCDYVKEHCRCDLYDFINQGM